MKALSSLRERAAGLRAALRWLLPGLGIKRWIGLMLVGATLGGLGMAYLLIDLYRTEPLPQVASTLTLQFLPRLARGALFGAAGLAALVVAVLQINRTLLAPFVRSGQHVVDVVSEHRRRGRGPKVVAIGGGTGLATLLRGLKKHTSNITAVVTVADDGGSSGRLRQSLGVLPPGDFRNCIAALSDDESLITQLFQYRFGGGGELGGHSFGNLFITAMAEVTGSFERAVFESSRVLNIRGQVLPATLKDVTLVGEVVEAGQALNLVAGESRLTAAAGVIRRVFLEPGDAPAYPATIRALLDADLVVLGPGSLYTSLLPNLLVPDLREAVRASRAMKVYVCNTATQPGETDGYSAGEHLAAIERHSGPDLFSTMLVNVAQRGELLAGLAWVSPDGPERGGVRLIAADLIDEARPWRHDADKLAAALIEVLSSDQPPAPASPDTQP